eukprot:TRINITY_DN8517_c0_g1_i2.p1 TRINITY_DN8517_c0_g1~~TRINITY_DN8517_c0_g1_i2.p1  ORF type:complete len:153 (-),score=48.51 TRINITY_DN8517_c0_g1_i2:107-565(-)
MCIRDRCCALRMDVTETEELRAYQSEAQTSHKIQAALDKELQSCKALLRRSNAEIARREIAEAQAVAEAELERRARERVEEEFMRAVRAKDDQLLELQEQNEQLERELDTMRDALALEMQRPRGDGPDERSRGPQGVQSHKAAGWEEHGLGL